jgi:uncharacterized protein DUF3500
MLRSTLRVLGVLACAAAVGVSAGGKRPESAIADAAKAFLAKLEPAQREKAVFPFNADERMNWHFVPKYMERKGMALKEMNPTQQRAALDLLRAGLSEKGYDKAGTIRELEAILRAVENSQTRDRELYYFTVFGEPSDSGTWGWRYEGHHCSLNWTIVKGKSSGNSPQFYGSNPAEVRVDVPNAPKKGSRVLAPEEDLARALVQSLNDSQKAEAVLSPTAPSDISTGAQRTVAIQENKGLTYGKLTKEQQGMLVGIIQEYASAMPKELAEQRLEKIRKAGLDGIKFAWMGGLDKGQPHYYRIQGATFLIEYDNTQNNANHVHCVWRDFKGDWGMDLLAMHYQASPHRVAAAK